MIPVSQEFKDAILARSRCINVFMHVGVGIDNTAADDIASSEGARLPMSDTEQVVDATYEITKGIATFEGDGIPTAVSAQMKAPPLPGDQHNMEVGVWSGPISGADGSMDWSYTIRFGKVHKSALTIYSREVTVLKAEIAFLLRGAEVSKAVYETPNPRIEVKDVVEYDAICIRVLKVDQPFRHARITEVEFGTSTTISGSSVSGSVDYIAEEDPTGVTCPLHEVSFDIINTGGVFHFDSPTNGAQAISVGKPLLLSYQVETAKGFETVPCGRFYIRTVDMRGGKAYVVADDTRVLLMDVSRAWTVPMSQNIGKAIDGVCNDLFIPHLCDEALYTMFPPRDFVFTSETNFMEDMLNILQMMGLEMVPTSEGIIRFRPYAQGDSYGDVTEYELYSYPMKQSNLRAYNVVRVNFGSENYTVDLRADSSLQSMSQLLVSNPLIQTEEEAARVADHIVQTLHNQELDVDWIGDPSLEVGDVFGTPGKFTPAQGRKVIIQEIRYRGGLRSKTTMIM